MIAIFNNQGSGGNGSAITAPGNFCAISVAEPLSGDQAAGQNSASLIDEASYLIATGTTGVGTVAALQELGGDGTWRSLTSPAPITLANSQIYNGAVVGQFHGIRIAVSAVVGNGILYCELKGVTRP